VRKALSTLPWVEKRSIKPDTDNQQVTFGYRNKDEFDYDAVKDTIEGQTNFKVGEILHQE